ncbi:hypothetical protein LARI1_G009639, partial [Lachnellula arida]
PKKSTNAPLLHPAISNPHTSAHTPKIIYVAASSPFISTVKRVRKLLVGIEERSANASKSKSKGASYSELRGMMRRGDEGGFLEEVGRKGNGKGTEAKGEEVVLKATGKAVERLVGVAAWFMGEGGGEAYIVRVRTGECWGC